MGLIERLIFLAIGCGIGFILGYIVASLRDIKKELTDVDECVKHCNLDHEHILKRRDESGFMNRPMAASVGYFIALFLILIGLYQMHEQAEDLKANAENDLVSRCEAGVDSRNAQRAIVDAVYNLAIGAARRDEDAPPLTKEEVVRYNAYIDRTNAFRKDLYNKIKPPDFCLEYVEDDKVKPPTPPFPHYKVKDTR